MWKIVSSLLLWFALFCSAHAQFVPPGFPPGTFQNRAALDGPSYQGVGDIQAFTSWWGLEAYSAAVAATGTQKSVNLRRSSDAVQCDVLIATSGQLGLTSSTCNSSTQGGLTPAAFAGNVGTATCTLATTTLTCTGASATPTVGDPVSGVGIDSDCYLTVVNTFTGGAGTATALKANTRASCGTVGSGETVTFQVPLFVVTAYDQVTTCDQTQATTGSQPQFFPAGGPGSGGPFMQSTASQLLAGCTKAPTTGVVSFVAVANTTAETAGVLVRQVGGAANKFFLTASGQWSVQGGTSGSIAKAVTDSVWHAGSAVVNGASPASVINVDGSETTGSTVGATGSGQTGFLLSGPGSTFNRMTEGGYVDAVALSSTVRTQLNANMHARYGF